MRVGQPDLRFNILLSELSEKTPFAPLRSGPKAASRPSRQKQIPSSSSEYQSWALLCNLYRDVWALPGDLGLTVIDDLLQKSRPEIAEMFRAE